MPPAPPSLSYRYCSQHGRHDDEVAQDDADWS
jgi:hypothetical protein